MRSREDLRRAQKWMVGKIVDQTAVILAWDMGAGKTATVLTAVRRCLDRGEVAKVLIVAPLLVAETTWPDEFQEWLHTRVLRYSIVTGTAKEREAAARSPVEIHIINRENLPWLWEFHGGDKGWPYDCLVVDEASMLKNAKKRTKTKGLTRFGVLAKARKHADRIVLMTGTPAPKGLHNLWGLAYIADLGERLGTSKHWFEQRWFEKDYMGWNLTPRPNAERQITDRLSDIMFSLAPEDYAELPPMVDNIIKVRLPKKVLDEYRRFEKTLVSEVYDVEAVSRGVLTNKLTQFANGSMFQEDGNHVWIHDAKLDALENIIDEANGSPVLVAYSFKFDLERIRKRFKRAVLISEDKRAVERWNRGEIELLIAHPASAGHGLNLQHGGNILVWYGCPVDLELFLQMQKRLHRSGQTKTVFNHYLIAKDTHDEDIMEVLKRKDATQKSILESVQVRLKKLPA